MQVYVVRRLLQAFLVCIGVSIIAFGLLHLAGDPVELLAPLEGDKEDVELLRKELGLDKPIYVQYGRFLKGALRGNFGESLFMDQDALELVFERMPATLQLTFVGLGLSLLFSIPLGILSAIKRYSIIDNLSTMAAVFGQAIPLFWLGLMMIIVFSVWLKNAGPASGIGGIKHIIMPAITMAVFQAPVIMRLTRSRMLDVLEKDYVRTAKASGHSTFKVLFKYSLRNAIIPVVSIIGLQFGRLLGGAIVTETVFSWPGVASLTVQAIRNFDYPVVQAAIVTFALMIVLVNLLTDIVVAALDPRIKYS